MDQKQQGQLDPTLKAAYDKVMGTNGDLPTPPAEAPTTPAASVAPNPNPTGTETQLPTMPTVGIPTVSASSAQTPITPPPTPPLSDTMHQTISIPQAGTITMQQPQTVHIEMQSPTAQKTKIKGKVSPIIYIFAGIAFFVVYVLFWIRIFNIPLPFLPK